MVLSSVTLEGELELWLEEDEEVEVENIIDGFAEKYSNKMIGNEWELYLR